MDKIELGKRAVACKGWRWRKGMTAMGTIRFGKNGQFMSEGRHLVGYTENGQNPGTLVSRRGNRCGWAIIESPLPDLDDPATIGCLLALVREVYGDALIAVWWSSIVESYVLSGKGDQFITGRTEAEALVKALEKAGAR